MIYTTESDLMAYAGGQNEIDLLFSDINLGETRKNGIEVVKEFQKLQPDCQVVYLTNYLTFATDVYDTPHLYFVLKAELEQRLPDVLNKVTASLPNERSKPLRVKQKGVEVMIAPESIIYCEHNGRKTYIVTRGETFTVYQKISELMELLDPRDFIRCHSSYIVHLRFVAKFRRTSFIMTSGEAIPISRMNAAQAKQQFSDFLSREL